MMKEKINEETTEVLESSVPEELQKYLEADENAISDIDGVLEDIDNRKESLNSEKEESEKEFDNRLAEFQDMIAKEREAALEDFARREQDLDAEKSRIEDIKLDQQSKQVNYIDSLKEISDTYNSKIKTIEEAIKACEDNETLTKALEEEKEKLLQTLESSYNDRILELNDALKEVGLDSEPSIDPDTEINLDFRTEEEKERDSKKQINESYLTPDTEINLDFRTEEEKERDLLKELETGKNNLDNNLDLLNISDENEVVDYEAREDVINDIYQSKDIMEGHVFPYLKSIME